MRRSPRALLTAIWLTALFGLMVSRAWAQVYTYAYDEFGRLISVVDPSGNAAVYSYDKVGNLLSIANTTSSTASIFTLTPNNASIGSSITIYGDGFSTTPNYNSVVFTGGVVGTVTASTVASITVTVPSGAQTGVIHVQCPNGSPTSPINFTVN